MTKSLVLSCDGCGAAAQVEKFTHESPGAAPIQWPKVSVRNGCVYLVVNCPNCGSHEQCAGCEN